MVIRLPHHCGHFRLSSSRCAASASCSGPAGRGASSGRTDLDRAAGNPCDRHAPGPCPDAAQGRRLDSADPRHRGGLRRHRGRRGRGQVRRIIRLRLGPDPPARLRHLGRDRLAGWRQRRHGPASAGVRARRGRRRCCQPCRCHPRRRHRAARARAAAAAHARSGHGVAGRRPGRRGQGAGHQDRSAGRHRRTGPVSRPARRQGRRQRRRPADLIPGRAAPAGGRADPSGPVGRRLGARARRGHHRQGGRGDSDHAGRQRPADKPGGHQGTGGRETAARRRGGRRIHLGECARGQGGVAETGIQLPGGGQVLFPMRRIVALYGSPGTAALGALGQQVWPPASPGPDRSRPGTPR